MTAADCRLVTWLQTYLLTFISTALTIVPCCRRRRHQRSSYAIRSSTLVKLRLTKTLLCTDSAADRRSDFAWLITDSTSSLHPKIGSRRAAVERDHYKQHPNVSYTQLLDPIRSPPSTIDGMVLRRWRHVGNQAGHNNRLSTTRRSAYMAVATASRKLTGWLVVDRRPLALSASTLEIYETRLIAPLKSAGSCCCVGGSVPDIVLQDDAGTAVVSSLSPQYQ